MMPSQKEHELAAIVIFIYINTKLTYKYTFITEQSAKLIVAVNYTVKGFGR